ncbi:MAG TPA: hypothetical protein VL123_00425 [Candidatus Udaeobacter sp.]|nr:hypothetical protein [Candidatus Udaeobacter sp.]
MKRIRYHRLATATFALLALCLTSTLARADVRTCPGNTPTPTGAVVTTRDYNNCPTSTVTVTNAYPAVISVLDDTLDCFGFANRHTWSFSTDGTTDAQFENCSLYRFCADVTLSGTGLGEGGLRLSPWWSPHDDGQFMINAQTGEIACFGGRLPFYSFTVAYGLHYVKGTTVHMEIIYNPEHLDVTEPATIIYNIVVGGTPYTSGKLHFDQGNTTEDPPHGLWGELWPAYAGGYVMGYLGQGTNVNFQGTWANICFDNVAVTPTHKSTWGGLKTLYR